MTTIQTPNSSAINELTFNKVDNTLKVTYKNETVYLFEGVTTDEFNAIQNASSIGHETHKVVEAKKYTKVK